MTQFDYKIKDGDLTYEFKNLADAWKFADDNGLERCPRIFERDNRHPYQRGPIYWQNNLQFWHGNEVGKMKYSDKAKAYYDNWLQDMFKNEKVTTMLQSGLK
jgi:hypothetical protein